MAVWREINNTDGRYEISEWGQLRNSKTKKLLRLFPNRDGYLKYVGYLGENNRITIRIHRAVAEQFLPTWDEQLTVNHKDGNKLNNHISNLEMVSVSENNRHRNVNNQYNYRSPKLPDDKVLLVLKDNKRTLNNQEWADRLGVSRFVIRDIRLGKTYKNLVANHG